MGTTTAATSGAEQAFTQAAQKTGVPLEVLKAICQMEGRMSMHAGSPSMSNGYGCMNLVHTDTDGCKALVEYKGAVCTHPFVRKSIDTLNHAAQLMHIKPDQIKQDLATNILAGAWILREHALAMSANHTLPTQLGDWYGAVAAYSNAKVPSIATMYADGAFAWISKGFTSQTDQGETVILQPQTTTPHRQTFVTTQNNTLPAGCTQEAAEYAPAVNCILDPKTHDCNLVATDEPCNYEATKAPQNLAISHIVIHDVEGSGRSALATFHDPNSAVSAHYIVDTDGTVYQVLRNKDIGFHAGNFWYNERSIGIEHAGFAADGFKWYNAVQYLASAKLVAYLIKRFNIPFDHDHIVSHGTIPSPFLDVSPNHVDPGPYWLWEFYGRLIHEQGIPYPVSKIKPHIGTITLFPASGRKPLGRYGTETKDNFNFFFLHTHPSTASPLIPHIGSDQDVTDETANVETTISYYYTDKKIDQAGTGKIMYQIWYGAQDQVTATHPENQFAHAQQGWLAVPPRAALEFIGLGSPVSLEFTNMGSPVYLKYKKDYAHKNEYAVPIYGRPVTKQDELQKFQIGDAPDDAIFISAYTFTVIEADRTQTLWYEINYNHRQAWVPASTVTRA